MAEGKNHIPQLDGMRAVAVMLVVIYHAWPSLPIAGWYGVTIFFVLSGYLITSIALREESVMGKISFGAFYVRRTLRIFPLYYLTLTLNCFLILVVGFQPQKRVALLDALPYYVSYLQEFAITFRGGFQKLPFGQSWSLGIEEKFYLVWPLLAFGLLTRKRHARVLVAIALMLICVCSGGLDPIYRYLVFPYSSILIGCVTALWAPKLCRFAVEQKLAYPALAAALILQIGVGPRVQSPWGVSLSETGYGVAVALLLCAIVSEDSVLRSLLAWSPLAYIGRVSYGIYLIHNLCLHLVRRFSTTPAVVLLLTCAASIGAASLLYYLIERPLIGLGKRLSSRIQQKSNRGQNLGALSTPQEQDCLAERK